ncbi:MAG: hypothetical protein LLG00_12395, partial [Planctomycetaceae bacterium]|nr:hypothetical protein [Planctomycetaceae bacterium]
ARLLTPTCRRRAVYTPCRLQVNPATIHATARPSVVISGHSATSEIGPTTFLEIKCRTCMIGAAESRPVWQRAALRSGKPTRFGNGSAPPCDARLACDQPRAARPRGHRLAGNDPAGSHADMLRPFARWQFDWAIFHMLDRQCRPHLAHAPGVAADSVSGRFTLR